MSERPKIEPCPHCGAPGQMKVIDKPYRHGWVGCPECRLFINWNIDPAGAVRAWNRRTSVRVDAPIFDREELFPDCTVQVLTNSLTGEQSVGWWPNKEAPP